MVPKTLHRNSKDLTTCIPQYTEGKQIFLHQRHPLWLLLLQMRFIKILHFNKPIHTRNLLQGTVHLEEIWHILQEHSVQTEKKTNISFVSVHSITNHVQFGFISTKGITTFRLPIPILRYSLLNIGQTKRFVNTPTLRVLINTVAVAPHLEYLIDTRNTLCREPPQERPHQIKFQIIQ